MSERKIVRSDLICCECGEVFPIQRRYSRQKRKYYKMNLYCSKCKKTTDHIELKDVGILKKKLEYKEYLNETEKQVLNLLQNKDNMVLSLKNRR